ncbi:unnamed protein product [Acanthoscelides obtectus]|uniref:E3 ubiquitin-protein ligase APD1-4 middle domain-containing protein n=1 Tax=Acanthoscelides obtectus TaxID=200917 RepID=A0A9P0KC89_ACAOB|nr:unnamed protein product [Acanthoscelides obtectus]CAK1660913.1 hypothetical protein AOBTE_LOCUS22331 [Acanthoscelides obtectus]
MHGVKRVVIFCLMTAVVPTVLIIVPLYLRHTVFAPVVYPVAESDVLSIEEGVSGIFCESLNLKMNSSFNAFQLGGTPRISTKRKHIRLKKSMTLPDDTLEYWGFYLLKGAKVKLKVCSRYDGSRILVVRGGKNLNTCALMEHNYKKYGAKMDAEHSRVKVTYEKPAEVLGMVDAEVERDVGKEDLSEDDDTIRKRLQLNRLNMNQSEDSTTPKVEVENTNNTKIRHRKRHARKWLHKLQSLKKELGGEASNVDIRRKRSISPLDAHIKHGGNALNFSLIALQSDSVSSFESDLLTCYDGKILLTRGFLPSESCNSVNYLEKSNHMVTEHTVASNGYYYYIFYSDNDLVKNDIHAVFDIYKPTYRFSEKSSKECMNQTECEFPINIFSDETVIVEVPTRDGIEHEEDDITLLTSTCNPRMGVYMIFPILVLLLILLCAFL